MKKDKRPRCDCGEILIIEMDKTYEEAYKIKKDGTKYKSPIAKLLLDTDGERLFCNCCKSIYEVEFDSIGTIIRGEKDIIKGS